MFRSSLRRAIVGACLLALLLPSGVFGHAELTEAAPGPDEVITVVPAELVAQFSQRLRADRTSIEVRDPTGATIASGGKDPDRARVQRVALPPLVPGEYEVRWVSYSAEDGELARGRYRFEVLEAVASPSTVPGTLAPCPSTGPSGSANPTVETSPAPTMTAVPSAFPSVSAPPGPIDPCASPALTPGASSLPSASAVPAPQP